MKKKRDLARGIDSGFVNVLMKRSLTVSEGSLFNYIMGRANAVMEGIQKGWLKFRIDQVFPLEKASDAHQKLESRSSSGKILLKT